MKKILVVDDSKTILFGLKESLESNKEYKVYTAKTYKECATLLLQEKGDFDIALLDYNLPDAKNGEIVEFISKFNIKSILLTATTLENTNPILKHETIVDYVIKDGSHAIEYATSIVNRIIENEEVEVLIVDDSKTFAYKMQALCEKYNLKTSVRLNGEDGLAALIERPKIKLVLVDYMMPDMNGLEFTSKLRKRAKKDEISVIALSGSEDKELVSKFLKYGANDFLYKDFTREEFFARINSNIEIIQLFDQVRDKATRDYMTGMFNRRYFFDTGREIYERAKAREQNLCLAMIDIDNFKNINDTWGHEAGDLAIKEVGNVLSQYLNKDCLIARVGGEEFCILMLNRPEEEVIQSFEEIRDAFEKNKIRLDNHKLGYTVSIGLSIDYGESLEQMMKYADVSLYEAKDKGRNQVNMYQGIF